MSTELFYYLLGLPAGLLATFLCKRAIQRDQLWVFLQATGLFISWVGIARFLMVGSRGARPTETYFFLAVEPLVALLAAYGVCCLLPPGERSILFFRWQWCAARHDEFL